MKTQKRIQLMTYSTLLKLTLSILMLCSFTSEIWAQNDVYLINRFRKVPLMVEGENFVTEVSWFSTNSWVIQPAGGEYFRIVKKGSKKSINVERGPVVCSEVPQGYWTSHWKKVPVPGTNFFRIQNRFHSDQFLHMEQLPLVSSNVPAGYWTSHWEFKEERNDPCMDGQTAQIAFIPQSPSMMAVITHQNTVNFGNYYLEYGIRGSGTKEVQTTVNKNAFLLTNLTENQYYRVDLSKKCPGGTRTGGYIGGNFLAGSNAGAPACTPPTRASEDFFCNLTSSSAHVFWQFVNSIPFGSSGNDRESYQIRYRKVGSSEWNTLSSAFPNKELRNLSPYTQYEYQVNAKCSDGRRTAYSKSFHFTTLPVL